jgi:hypothetical protein
MDLLLKKVPTKTGLFLLSLMFVLFAGAGTAQVAVKWEKELSGNLLWQQVTALGNLIVSTEAGLKRIDTETGELSWELAGLANLGGEQFTELQDGPFFKVETSDAFYLIDQFSGDVVFDSRKTAIVDIQGYYTLYKLGGILVAGLNKTGEPAMIFVSMIDASVQWSLNEQFGRIVAVNELTDYSILVVTLFNNYKINTKTGEIIWKVPNSQEAEDLDNLGRFGALIKDLAEEAADQFVTDMQFFRKPNSDYFYLVSCSPKETFDDQPTGKFESSMTAYRLSDGSRVWDRPLEFAGRLDFLIFKENGFILLPNKGDFHKINLYSYETKEGLWGKRGDGYSPRGDIYTYLETDNGIMIASEEGNQNGFLTYINYATGEPVFKRPVKIDGKIAGVVPTATSVFYITNEGLNIIDLSTGELKWRRNFPTQPALTAKKDGDLYAFDLKEEVVTIINLESEEVRTLTSAPLSFDGKEEPIHLELMEDGILLSSDQNIAKYSMDGTLHFNHYYPAPREAAWRQVLLYASAAYATLVAADAYYTAAVLSNAEQEIRGESALAGDIVGELKDGYADYGDDASSYFLDAVTMASARKKATTGGLDYNFIMSKEGKEILLLQVSKATGETEGQISLGRDREPRYTVDFVTNQVYYQKNSSVLASYQVQ